MHTKRRESFPFLGLVRCGECGGAITAERQRGHHYYRCAKKLGPCHAALYPRGGPGRSGERCRSTGRAVRCLGRKDAGADRGMESYGGPDLGWFRSGEPSAPLGHPGQARCAPRWHDYARGIPRA
ncbi:MAG: recombinase zinc ribbon domain-containing protein [Acidiferrobacteraceae bacterium]